MIKPKSGFPKSGFPKSGFGKTGKPQAPLRAQPRSQPAADKLADGPEALAAFDLPPETMARFEIYAGILRKWQKTINLVGPSTLNHLWTRHFGDSLQVCAALPAARRWIDIGSGAGFPGLVTAIKLAPLDGARVYLVESDQRKCAFLRDVSRETGAPVEIHTGRAEGFLATFADPIDAISARALAPLPNLIRLAENLLEKGAIGVFPQGQNASIELTDSSLVNRFNVEEIPGDFSPGSRLAIVRAKSMI